MKKEVVSKQETTSSYLAKALLKIFVALIAEPFALALMLIHLHSVTS